MCSSMNPGQMDNINKIGKTNCPKNQNSAKMAFKPPKNGT